MAFMRRILWFDNQGHKHVTWKSFGDDTAGGGSSATTVASTVPTPSTLPPATSTPDGSMSLAGLPWYLVGAAALGAYWLLFGKKKKG